MVQIWYSFCFYSAKCFQKTSKFGLVHICSIFKLARPFKGKNIAPYFGNNLSGHSNQWHYNKVIDSTKAVTQHFLDKSFKKL